LNAGNICARSAHRKVPGTCARACRGHARVPQHPPSAMRATRDPSPTVHGPVRILLVCESVSNHTFLPSRRVSNSGQTAGPWHGRQCLRWQRALVQPWRTQRVRPLAPVPRTHALAPAPTTHNVCAGDNHACPSTHHAQCDGACSPCVRSAHAKGCRGHARVPQHPPRTMRATRNPSPSFSFDLKFWVGNPFCRARVSGSYKYQVPQENTSKDMKHQSKIKLDAHFRPLLGFVPEMSVKFYF
jgi:hypothetical protein